MRKTRKYVAAKKRLRELKIRTHKRENADIYALLESHRQIWDNKSGKWIEGTKSMFGDEQPSGIVRIRVMSHPADVQRAVTEIKQHAQLKVVEVSDEYPNRRGIGVRVYLTCMLKDQS